MANQAKYGENLSFFTEKSKTDVKTTAKKEEKATTTTPKATTTTPKATQQPQGGTTGNYGVGNLSRGAINILSQVFGGSGKINATPKTASYGANIKKKQEDTNNG